MNIGSSVRNFYNNAKRSVSEAIVGDDYARQSGMTDGVVLGVATGAAVGGVIGGVAGFHSQSQDSIQETTATEQITKPRLTGYSYSVSKDWDEICTGTGEDEVCVDELAGWRHRYSPNISNRVVGDYTHPDFAHTHKFTALTASLTGAATGIGAGAAVGLAVGLIGKALDKHPLERKKSLPYEVKSDLVEQTGDVLMKSTAVGAGVGALAGFTAGVMEKNGALNITRTWDEPSYHRVNLGSIPRDHYERNWGFTDWGSGTNYRNHSPSGTTSVIRNTPNLDSSGRPALHSVTKEVSSSRLGPVSGLIGGAFVGAGLGFATGVAAGVINRALAQPE